jgi:hypothetical protein
MPTLASLNMAWKLLISGFLVVLSCGFAVAHKYLDHTTEMADGKPGLTMDDITYQFYGDRTKTTLKKMVNGSMKKFFQENRDVDKLTPEDQADIKAVLDWNDSGAKEEEYWNPKDHSDKNPKLIINVMDRNGCLDCHYEGGKKPNAPMDTFVAVSKYTKGDEGMDEGRLLMLSHVHLLGMGMMFLLAGGAVAMTQFPMGLRCLIIVGGMLSVLLDIFGWWFVKYGGATYAPVVMAGGGLMAITFGASVLAAFFDLWIRKKPITPTATA